MKHRVIIGNSEYKVKVEEKGGQVLVYRNKELTFCGQWFPEDKNLTLFNCNFEDIRVKLEKCISNFSEIENVIFPYVSEQYR